MIIEPTRGKIYSQIVLTIPQMIFLLAAFMKNEMRQKTNSHHEIDLGIFYLRKPGERERGRWMEEERRERAGEQEIEGGKKKDREGVREEEERGGREEGRKQEGERERGEG